MSTSRITIYLHDGRAWVAELKDGRARVWSLTAWLSAHPGRGALRSLAYGPVSPPAAGARSPWSRRARAALASLIGRPRGREPSSDARPDAAAG